MRARRERRPRLPGRGAIITAALLLLVIAVGLFIVSVSAQYQYLLPARHNQKTPSAIMAGSLDAMMITFSLLAFGLSRAGKPAPIERALIMACAVASAGMNLSEANLGSPRSVAAYVVAPLALAVTIDRLIAVVYRFYTERPERSVWSGLGRFGLYALRLALSPWPTAMGLRRMALAAAPIPEKLPRVVVVVPDPLPLTTTTPGADHATTTTLDRADHDHTVAATTTTRELDHDHATTTTEADHDHAPEPTTTTQAGDHGADHDHAKPTTGNADHATTQAGAPLPAGRTADNHALTTPDHGRTTDGPRQVTASPPADQVEAAPLPDHATTTTTQAGNPDHDHAAAPTTTTRDHDHGQEINPTTTTTTTTTGQADHDHDHATAPTTTTADHALTADHDHAEKATTTTPADHAADHDNATTGQAVSAPMPGAADVRFAQEAIALARGISPEQVPVREVAAYLEPEASRERLTKVGKYVSTVRGRDKAAQARAAASQPASEREAAG